MTDRQDEMAHKITVVVEESFAPFVQVEDDRVVGLAVDALDALARQAGLEIEYLPAPASLIQAIIAEGRAAAAFPLAINPERLAVFDFSDPVLVTGGGFFVAAPSPAPVALADLRAGRIATPATGPLAAFLRTHAPDLTLFPTGDYIEPLRMVVSGEADAAALNLEAGSILAERLFPGRISLPASHFLQLPLALGVPKRGGETSSILRRVNEAIRAGRGAKAPDAE